VTLARSGGPGRAATAILAIPPLAFLLLFFVWPVLAILVTGLAPEGRLAVDAIAQALGRPWLLDTIVFTIALSVAITGASFAVGMPAAWLLSRFTFPGRTALRVLVAIPFVLPTVVVASAFLALLGPRGIVPTRLADSVVAIVVAGAFYDVSVVVRLVGGLRSHLDPRTEDAARALGASPWGAFREVTWPLLRPAVVSAASVILLFSITSFGLVLLLGAPGQPTLEVEIWRQASVMLDLPAAATLAVIQIVGVTALLVANARWQERLALAQRLRPATEVARAPRTSRERIAVIAIGVGLVVCIGAPLAALVERSLHPGDGYGLAAWDALLHGSVTRNVVQASPADAIATSLVFAVATVCIALPLGLAAALVVGYRRGWLPRGFDALVMLPLGTSAVIVGLGFLVALDQPPLDLRASIVLVPLAHGLIALPFVVRAISPVVRSIDPRLREAAAMLGASPRRAWREVDLPLIARAALVGAAFAFAVSLGEFGATLFLARPETTTVPVAIDRLLSRPGPIAFGQAMALSTILMAMTASAMLVIERWRAPGRSEF
jgi:thiamine transport system permease protein